MHKNAKIYCAGDCHNGDVRLSEGQTEWEGRLELCLNQRWGTVGSNGQTAINSQVVCNALGYDFSGIATHITHDDYRIKIPD